MHCKGMEELSKISRIFLVPVQEWSMQKPAELQR